MDVDMHLEIWTYRSENAPDNQRWLAYIKDDSSPHTWPVRHPGRTEEEAYQRALDGYNENREKREATIAARRAAAEKRKKTIDERS